MNRFIGSALALAASTLAEPSPAQPIPTEPRGWRTPPRAHPAASDPSTLVPDPPPKARRLDSLPFRRGAIAVTLTLASGFLDDNDYLIVGAGIGAYVLDGFELGMDGAIWLFDSPTIGVLTPQAKYVFEFVPVVKPYFGGFFRHYMVDDDVDDFNSVGGRAGLYFVPNTGAYFGLGGLYEHLFDCSSRILSCDEWYPEVLIAVSF